MGNMGTLVNAEDFDRVRTAVAAYDRRVKAAGSFLDVPKGASAQVPILYPRSATDNANREIDAAWSELSAKVSDDELTAYFAQVKRNGASSA